MMQKDYILRMIQQLSKVLIHILHLREIKDYEGALTYIDDVFKQALGFSSDLINSVPDETLLAMLTSFDVLDIEKCFLTANLLKDCSCVLNPRLHSLDHMEWLEKRAPRPRLSLRNRQFAREH